MVGYGFNSNGRYAQGALIRARFRPRVLEAKPESLLDNTGNNLDPTKVWACMMTNEKPGGHGERSVAVGTIDMAVWDAVAKIEGKPLFQLLAERYGDGKPNRRVFVYAAGGYYYPGKDLEALKDEERKYLDLGYSVVKQKIAGASLSEDLKRIEAVLSILGPGRPAGTVLLAVRPDHPDPGRCGRLQHSGTAACSRGIAPSSGWKRGPTETGSAPVRRLPGGTTSRRSSSNRAVLRRGGRKS